MDLSQNTVVNDSPLLSEEDKKTCTDCKTSKTPLWRYGPAGPKTLCNACGIRHWKKIPKKTSDLGANKALSVKKKKIESNNTTSSKTTTNNTNLTKSLKMGLMILGREVVMLQRPRSSIARKQRRRVIGEEEEAAVLLLSLSCGSVFA